jgi:hypothetical protein
MKIQLAEMTLMDWINTISWIFGVICMIISVWTHNHHLSCLGAILALGAKN